jgi:hypothetical protein
MAWGLALLAGAALFLARMFPAGSDTAAIGAPAVDAPATHAPEPTAGPSGTSPPRTGGIHRSTGARRKLPHPGRSRPVAGSTAGEVGEAVDAAEADTGALPEAGRGVAGVAFSPEAIMDAMAGVTPAITACVEEWQAVLAEELEGRLVLELTLGPEGVLDAELVDVDGVPEPMLGCFGGVVYEAQWPLPDEVTEVAWPFLLELSAD